MGAFVSMFRATRNGSKADEPQVFICIFSTLRMPGVTTSEAIETMGRKSLSGGVRAKGGDRIEFTFVLAGKRYRPTLPLAPTEANLRRARERLKGIKARIDAGTFDFSEEFPDYKLRDELKVIAPSGSGRTCRKVFEAFIAHCEMLVEMNSLAFSTVNGYRRILDSVWTPAIGEDAFEEVTYSRLSAIVAAHTRKKKTYNNVVSALRCAFEFGYKDHPHKHNPAAGLDTLRITKKDRPPIDPFAIEEGEKIIAASHAEFGAAHGNYEEFRFFTGLRQSEQIALTIHDCDTTRGTISVNKAIVLGKHKDRTKTGEDRQIALCARAQQVLKRQLELRAALVQAGKIAHEFVFFQEDGAPLVNLSYPYDRWRYVMESRQLRYREPYNTRHSYISWRLMIGANVLLVAQEDGHSVQTMLSTYAAWTKGATDADVEQIKQAMERSPEPIYPAPSHDGLHCLAPPRFATDLPPEGGWGRLSWRKHLQRTGGADGTRTRDPRRDRPVF
jgi:integrase